MKLLFHQVRDISTAAEALKSPTKSAEPANSEELGSALLKAWDGKRALIHADDMVLSLMPDLSRHMTSVISWAVSSLSAY
ncbi:Kinesin-Like Protein Kif19 [Manis pentadactyla]|nr:Kinesin-Like Protein Kif19 [Manis pentadactyla]